MRLSPLNARRLANFRANRRGYWSLWVFTALLLVSLFAEVIANDKPLLISYAGKVYFPTFVAYPETTFGGFFETEASYTDPEVTALIEAKGWMVWPPIPYSYDTVSHDLSVPAPSPPSWHHWLGTDDQARDVVARLIYGYRISVLFGLTLTVFSSLIGVAAGAVQGYFGGWIDLGFQRFIEMWSGLPTLYLLIILASIVTPSFWWLLGLMLLFSWMALVGVVRAEFLRGRNFDYVRAARALGVGDPRIMWRHLLPNAMVATLTFLPFVTSSAVTTLTALDFLGFGLPPGSASLGELLKQGKDNLQAPWLGFTGFFVIALMLSLLVFVGEAVRDAFDPRRIFKALDESEPAGAVKAAPTNEPTVPGRHARGLQPGIQEGTRSGFPLEDCGNDEKTHQSDGFIGPTNQASVWSSSQGERERVPDSESNDSQTVRAEALEARPEPRRRARSSPPSTIPTGVPALLVVNDLRVRFGSGRSAVEAVRSVSFSIERGEALALVGESGSGKSVTALSILQLLPYPLASHPSGSIRLQGHELMGADGATLRKIRGDRVAMIFQEPMSSLNPLHSIERQVNETLLLHKGLDRAAARARTWELLRLVGIEEPERRLGAFPHELSGGQRQRVMIAMALANEPDLLIADEPTTAVDVTIQAQLLALLADLQKRMGMAMLFITHDLGIVRKIADRVCVMQHGQLVETGDTQAVLTQPQHPYTQQLLAAQPKGAPVPPPAGGGSVMACDALKVWYPVKAGVLRRTVDYVRAVDGVGLHVREGETVGVVGESGSGKTTLGLALLRLIASKGPIQFRGREIQTVRSQTLRPLRRDMQIVFQDPYSSLSPRLSVGQIIEEGLAVHALGGSSAERERLIVAALEEVGLDPETRHRYPHEFSGGQRQRVAIARAMVLQPKFVVLDEPTSALDVSVQTQIVDLLRALQAKHGVAYLFISHDLRVVRAMSHTVLVMRHGVVVEHGPAEEVFNTPREAYTKTLLAAAFNIEATRTDAVT